MPSRIGPSLQEVKPFSIPMSSARYFVHEASLEVVDDREVLVVTLGAAAGETVRGLNEETGLEEVITLDKKKIISHATVLVDSAGNITHDVKSNYLTGPRVRSAFEMALRLALGHNLPFTLEPRPLQGSPAVMRQWIADLEALSYVRFAGLRHSNPHPPIAYIDQLTDIMVDEMAQKSAKEGGIVRDSQVFQDTLDHAERYGRIASASGTFGGQREAIDEEEGEIQLTIWVKDVDKKDVMFRTLKRYTRQRRV